MHPTAAWEQLIQSILVNVFDEPFPFSLPRDTDIMTDAIEASDLNLDGVEFRTVGFGEKELYMSDLIDAEDGTPQTVRLSCHVLNPTIIYNDTYKSHALLAGIDTADAQVLEKIHGALRTQAMGWTGTAVDQTWTFKPVFRTGGTTDYFFKLKPEKGNKKFEKVISNIRLTPNKAPDGVYKGQPVDVEVEVSGWFNTQKKEAGLRLVVRELDFQISTKAAKAAAK
jgi:hypothetical protein